MYIYISIHIRSLSSLDFTLQAALYSLLFPSPLSYHTVKLSLYLPVCPAVILSNKSSPALKQFLYQMCIILLWKSCSCPLPKSD